MVAQFTCNVADLGTFIPTTEDPWDTDKVKHLYRRIGIDLVVQELRILQNELVMEGTQDIPLFRGT